MTFHDCDKPIIIHTHKSAINKDIILKLKTLEIILDHLRNIISLGSTLPHLAMTYYNHGHKF